MAAAISAVLHFHHTPPLRRKNSSLTTPIFCPCIKILNRTSNTKLDFTACFALKKEETKLVDTPDSEEESEEQTKLVETLDFEEESEEQISPSMRAAEKMARKKNERFIYLISALMSSLGITSITAFAVYYRFYWQMEGGEVPYSEIFGTFALSVGAAVGMELWARWAHNFLWHDSLWHMHESHHRPREGAFELNDTFVIINAVPAVSLFAYGILNKGLFPGLCFGAGLGITAFGMAYMFVHDGLVHRRFPVGPIADVPYLRKVAAAHQIHHTDKFNGVPFGLFLGHKELEEVEGGLDELKKEINRRIKSSKNN